MEDEEQDENNPKWLFRVSNGEGLAELSAPTQIDRREWVQKLNAAIENVPATTMDVALQEMKRIVRTRSTSVSQHDDKLLKDAEVLKRGYVDVFEISKGWKKYYVTLTPNALVAWRNYTQNKIHRKISVTPDTIVKSGSVIGFEDTVRKRKGDGMKETMQKVSNFIAKNNPLNKNRKRDPKTCLEVLSKHELHDPVYISATSAREAEKWRAAIVNASNRIEQDNEVYDTKKLAAELELFNDVCESNRLNVRTAVCFLFKVRRNSALFEEGASRLSTLLFDSSKVQHTAFDDCYFYLPQLLHIALNSKLHTAALERIMLRMCLTTKQTRENLRSIRFALMMFWLLQGYIEDQEHVRHATRLGLAVKKCVQDEPGSNRLPVSVLSRLRSSVDDDRFALSKEEQAEWKRIVDVKVDSTSTKNGDKDSLWKVLKRQQSIVHAMTEAAEALRLCGT